MKTSELSVLPDLMRMHKERISCYEKEISLLSLEDTDLKMLFLAMIDQSRAMRNRMEKEFQIFRQSAAATVSGNIYRVWKKFSGYFAAQGRENLIEECLMREEAALSIYSMAQTFYSLPHFIHALLNEQKAQLQSVVQELKKFLTM